MRESKVQRKIQDVLKAHGFWALKLVITSMRGFPDLIVFGHGMVFLIEVKKKGEPLRALQAKRQRQIRSHGVECQWFDNVDEAETWLIDTILPRVAGGTSS